MLATCFSYKLPSSGQKQNEVLVHYNEREENVINPRNLFRKMLYSNNKTTCFGL